MTRLLPTRLPRFLSGPVIAVFAAAWLLASAAAAGPAAAEAPVPDGLDALLAAGIGRFQAGSDAWDAGSLEEAARILGRACTAFPDSRAAAYWQGTALFTLTLHRCAEAAAARGRTDLDARIDAAARALERAAALDPDDAESQAMLATLAGLRMARHPAQALWLGPVYIRRRQRALQAGADNPRVAYLVGMGYARGAARQGGKAKALDALLRAERLFAAERLQPASRLTPRWGYDHCLMFIADLCLELGRPGEAARYWRKTLDVNPRNELARQRLQALGRRPAEVPARVIRK